MEDLNACKNHSYFIFNFHQLYGDRDDGFDKIQPWSAASHSGGCTFTVAIIGGSIGSIVGMFLFHHKIRMAKFRFGSL